MIWLKVTRLESHGKRKGRAEVHTQNEPADHTCCVTNPYFYSSQNQKSVQSSHYTGHKNISSARPKYGSEESRGRDKNNKS